VRGTLRAGQVHTVTHDTYARPLGAHRRDPGATGPAMCTGACVYRLWRDTQPARASSTAAHARVSPRATAWPARPGLPLSTTCGWTGRAAPASSSGWRAPPPPASACTAPSRRCRARWWREAECRDVVVTWQATLMDGHAVTPSAHAAATHTSFTSAGASGGSCLRRSISSRSTASSLRSSSGSSPSSSSAGGRRGGRAMRSRHSRWRRASSNWNGCCSHVQAPAVPAARTLLPLVQVDRLPVLGRLGLARGSDRRRGGEREEHRPHGAVWYKRSK
jgi:hypothetical protein